MQVARMDDGLRYRESWHRLKNAIQTIEILTKKQLRAAEGEEARRRLKALNDNIGMLIRLNETLHGGADLATAFQALAEYWQSTSGGQGFRVRFRIDKDMPVPMQNAISLALLTHEAVTNCIEHAFPDGRNGLVDITMGTDDGSAGVLTTADDGIGYPAGPEDSGSNGRGLMAALAQALGGEMTITARRPSGTVVSVRFPTDELETP